MTFEAVYFQYTLNPTTEVLDATMVCESKLALINCLGRLGALKLDDVPVKLARKKELLQSDYSQQAFTPFFLWLFEMGKAIAAANLGLDTSAVRVVPLPIALLLMQAGLSSWPLMPRLKTFFEDDFAQPITKATPYHAPARSRTRAVAVMHTACPS